MQMYRLMLNTGAVSFSAQYDMRGEAIENAQALWDVLDPSVRSSVMMMRDDECMGVYDRCRGDDEWEWTPAEASGRTAPRLLAAPMTDAELTQLVREVYPLCPDAKGRFCAFADLTMRWKRKGKGESPMSIEMRVADYFANLAPELVRDILMHVKARICNDDSCPMSPVTVRTIESDGFRELCRPRYIARTEAVLGPLTEAGTEEEAMTDLAYEVYGDLPPRATVLMMSSETDMIKWSSKLRVCIVPARFEDEPSAMARAVAICLSNISGEGVNSDRLEAWILAQRDYRRAIADASLPEDTLRMMLIYDEGEAPVKWSTEDRDTGRDMGLRASLSVDDLRIEIRMSMDRETRVQSIVCSSIDMLWRRWHDVIACSKGVPTHRVLGAPDGLSGKVSWNSAEAVQ